jgi:hypothetical protein
VAHRPSNVADVTAEPNRRSGRQATKENVQMAAKKMPAHNPRGTNPTGDDTKCRGRWSKCGGKNPAKSASWHLCAGPGSCTEKYRAMKKAEQASKPATPKAAKAPKSAGTTPKAAGTRKPRALKPNTALENITRDAKAPAPARVAHPRVTQESRPALAVVPVEA